MNAKEARDKVMSARTKKSEDQYKRIKAIIEKAVEDNRLNINWSDSIELPIRTKLIGEGFTVGQTYSFRNEYNTEISW